MLPTRTAASPSHFRPHGSSRALQRCFTTACLLCVCLVSCGCGSLRFRRAWSSFEPATAGGMVGRWKGEWHSEWNGHSGGLRCVLTAREEGTFLARFLSTYAYVFSFQHDTLFRVTASEGDTHRFEGEEDLGEAFGGIYRYVGSVDGDAFEATFAAENGDHGVFRMDRVE